MASDQELAATVEESPHRGQEPARVDLTELPRGTTIDRYVLIDKIGQGGMGVVYAAYDELLHRRVAVKLVTSRSGHDRPTRLLAEARAMAQLSHPAIVPIHDVGAYRDQVFLAMAFIDGTTLRAWQADEARTWPELIAMYRQIGEGLAFAHDEGIIHRDFKPDNVIVDDDLRPHITDFGLAKIVLAPEPTSTASAQAKHAVTGTLTGTIAGTPGYMSPQQSRGEPTDARTDQYAFCASLFEALHRGLPRDEPPPRAAVPRRILAAIERGLEDDPAKRWPSMRELLAALAPRERARRRRALLGAAVVVPAVLSIWLAARGGRERTSCELPQASALWQSARGQVQAAFARQGKSADELVAALDTWTTRWTDMARASCRATAGGSQSTQLLDLRARCLDHALDVTGSLVELASHGDPDTVRHAAKIAGNLPSLEPCADAAGLLGIEPLPAEPVRRALIAELTHRLATAEALVPIESYRAASEQLDSLAQPILATGYGPLIFEFYDTRSSIEIARDSDPAAAASAAWSAIAVDPARKDYHVAAVWIDLVWIVGVMQHAPAQAIEIGRIAEAIEQRVQDKHQMALLDHRLATVLVDAGKLDEAIARYERAHAAYEAQGDAYDAVASLAGEAAAVGAKGDRAKQLALFEQAVARAATLPHAQLLLADQLDELSIVYNEAGRYADATAALRRALAAVGDGRDDPALVAAIHGNLGNVLESTGDLEAAEAEYRTGLELAREKLGADVSDVELAWYNLGNIQNKRKHYADAIASLREAQGVLQRTPRDATKSAAYATYGEIARQLVTAHLGLGRATDALVAAEASLALAQRDGARPGVLADTHFALATAAWAAGDRERARVTMRLAAAEYHAAQADSADADAWLVAH